MSLSKQEFYIVDVFAEKKYAGNPLAVIICPEPLSAPDMQSIAREMNYSETTFLQPEPDADGGYRVRIFTPNSELPFAGHPCLGTAWIIRHLYSPDAQEITLKVPAGNIPVTFGSDGVLWMEQLQPSFGSRVTASAAAAVIGLETEEIDERYPARVVSTGIPFLLIPVKTLASVRSTVYRAEAAAALPAEAAVPVMPFCPETYDNANGINARVFVDELGVPEDPATGSANGCLAAYLARYRYFGGPSVETAVEQGYEIGRPSRLYLRASEMDGRFAIHVGGRVFFTAQGQLV
ncbi:PhzF family phenazine biosynthesis protein [Paenibacillus chitinolyticus]|uniref:PhzF family phenazine biosynthesis protein n=1 Tax=Paenibacillus chitinolyticus TaxID=79263 RepID=UPI002DB790EB|nr:PhzF family phenazine biosynthesis protein [Paenibacillus chitinolyticus]MEC0248254.1 PhzF family phenazine biosynthesis protein [Paenibacillus chitinolyticus]